MAVTPYENFVLSNLVEDQYKSHLNLEQFAVHDNSLELTPGMKRTVHTYTATDGTEILAKGVGNTKTIGASFTSKEYDILMAQSRFVYQDEDLMTDPEVVTVGAQHAGVDMFNQVNADIFAAFNTATLTSTATAPDFNCFVDASTLLNLENLQGVNKFAFVCAKDMAKIRKALKDDLKYMTEFSTSGYVGTVAGINLYTKKDAVENTIIMATDGAVTLFSKKGITVEPYTEGNRGATDGNTRTNTIFTRKYYLAALTDATKAVKITITAA